MKTLTERCEIELQALALGKTEYRDLDVAPEKWMTLKIDETFVFYWRTNDYRIKPAPREFFVIESPDGSFSSLQDTGALYSKADEDKIIKLQEIIE